MRCETTFNFRDDATTAAFENQECIERSDQSPQVAYFIRCSIIFGDDVHAMGIERMYDLEILVDPF